MSFLSRNPILGPVLPPPPHFRRQPSGIHDESSGSDRDLALSTGPGSSRDGFFVESLTKDIAVQFGDDDQMYVRCVADALRRKSLGRSQLSVDA